jgi:hypothetical protein
MEAMEAMEGMGGARRAGTENAGEKKALDRGPSFYGSISTLLWLDVRRLLAFRAGGHVESDALVFSQRFEAIRVDRREMREQVFAAFVWRDETETFCVVKPFYNAICHFNFQYQ